MKITDISSRTRLYRKIHRWIAALLFVFFLFISVTGLLLGWKKNTNGYLLANSHKGTTTDISKWLTFDSLQKSAVQAIRQHLGQDISVELDRIDARPSKGMVKFVFLDHYSAVQVDAATGKVLHMERRRADFIENLHDGSYIDRLFGLDGSVKLGYTTVMGISLLMLTITGFWLWYNPKRIRRMKRKGGLIGG
jgi:uncharacterized iron-regulated membrane protein